MVGVPALRMRQCQPVAEVRQLAIVTRPEDEVPVVRHQHVGEQADAGDVLKGFVEDALEGFVVAVLVEDLAAAITSVEDMVDIAAQGRAQGASHGGKSNPAAGVASREKGS